MELRCPHLTFNEGWTWSMEMHLFGTSIFPSTNSWTFNTVSYLTVKCSWYISFIYQNDPVINHPKLDVPGFYRFGCNVKFTLLLSKAQGQLPPVRHRLISPKTWREGKYSKDFIYNKDYHLSANLLVAHINCTGSAVYIIMLIWAFPRWSLTT